MTSDTKGGFLRQAFRAICAGLVVVALLLVASAVAVTSFVRQAATRIEVDPKALSDAVRDAVIVTIREGSLEQKLETMRSLEQVGAADAAPFVPALTDATTDEEPQVRQAA